MNKLLSKINEQMINKSNLKEILKKGVQIGVLGAALATGAVMGTGCAQPTEGTTIEKEDNTGVPGKNYATPTDKTIGNGYTIHKFVGENDGIGRANAVQDTNHYLSQAEGYIKGLANGFKQPEKFQNLIVNLQYSKNYNVDGSDGAQKLDTIINLFTPCHTVLTDIIDNLGGHGNAEKNLLEREAFEQCYRVLANEAYYEAYGSSRNKVKNNYEHEKNKLIAGWSPEENEFLESTNLINAYENKNFTQITYLTDRLLGKAAKNMGVSSADLRKVVNIALAGHSLCAMHDLVADLLNHKQETNMFSPVNTMQRETNRLYYDVEQYQNMSLER